MLLVVCFFCVKTIKCVISIVCVIRVAVFLCKDSKVCYELCVIRVAFFLCEDNKTCYVLCVLLESRLSSARTTKCGIGYVSY